MEPAHNAKMLKKLAKTEYAVWADSFAKSTLWIQYAKNATHYARGLKPDGGLPRVLWVQDTIGFNPKIGELDGRPIHLTLFWSTVDGLSVVFVDRSSSVTDYHLSEKWLRKRMPKLKTFENAQNFHMVLIMGQRAKKAKKPVQAAAKKRRTPKGA